MGIIPLTFLFLESQLLITQGLVIQFDDDPCRMSMKMVHVSYIYIYYPRDTNSTRLAEEKYREKRYK